MADDPRPGEGYDDAMIAMLELIWGEGFLSPGGPEAVRAIVAGLDLRDRLVLDIGCGIGGVDLVLARDHGARVIGLDVEAGVIDRARKRVSRSGPGDRVEVRLVEPGPLPIGDGAIDVVFGKDSWIHIEDKRAFFAEVLRVLKPGGWLAAGDWMRSPAPYSRDMTYFFEMEGLTYHMDTLANYGVILRELGFAEVALVDITECYRQQAHREYDAMRGPLRDRMRAVLGPEKQAHFVENWRAMTVVLDKGELRPGRLRARKAIQLL